MPGDQGSRSLPGHRLDEVLELAAVDPISAGVAVERVYDPSIPELLADAGRLTQVFLNLARNALQAMESKGGHLVVTTGVAVDQHLPGNDGRLLPAVVVTFRDDGPGISAADLERLATPFFTTKPKGTGLGLATVHQLVERQGGSLQVTSQLGSGTTVTVLLTAAES